MNFLTFVFALLMIFSFSFSVSIEKKISGRNLQKTYLAHNTVSRKLAAKSVSEVFSALPHKSKIQKTHSITNEVPKNPKVPSINAQCARLNLWPLVQEGKEKHPELFALILKYLHHFYGENLLKNSPEKSIDFLKVFIDSAKQMLQQREYALEKLFLSSEYQMIYYKMLRGSKEWHSAKKAYYPSFLDVFSLEEQPSKICLKHAHPKVLEALFNTVVAQKLYETIHSKDSPLITQELIEKICSEAHFLAFDPTLFDFIQFGRSSHTKSKQTTLFAKDLSSGVCMKKRIYSPQEVGKVMENLLP